MDNPKIAKLDLTYYDENEKYSDGDIEEYILSMLLKGYSEEEIINKNNNWAVFYHLSHLRHNILSWYPFNKDCSLLEVGSGCGALTKLFCEKGLDVVSVELTKMRGTINFERHKNFENLNIFIGNFNKIKFDKKFDYIVLNGVFEYAISYTKTDNPYVDFLKKIKSLLTPNGIILIAIENRIGLKYFAGAREDHLGSFFSGINGYKEDDYVRTFSKTELENIITNAEFLDYKFYYPHPDYKFPNTIHTDYSIEKIEYGNNYLPLDSDRFSFFNEYELNKTFIKEKIASNFANSFLVELKLSKSLLKEEPIYVKLNNDRKKEFQIYTKITKENNKLEVRKYPSNIKAVNHLKNMIKAYNINSNNDLLQYLNLEEKENYYFYKYYENKTFENLLIEYLNQGNIKDFEKKIFDFYEIISKNATNTNDYYTNEFENVFGKSKINEPLLCNNFSNIDLIFENILINDNKYIVIDYEWAFNFKVPISYIIWRAFNIFYDKFHKIISKYYSFNDLLELGKINIINIDCFINWETNFSKEYVSNNYYLNNHSKKIIKPLFEKHINDILNVNTYISNLYINYGEGYCEQNKIQSELIIKEGLFKLKFVINNIKDIKKIRWDPIEGHFCKCKILKILANTGNINLMPLNHYEYKDSFYEFYTTDPMFEIEGDYNGLCSVEIEGIIEILNFEHIILKVQKEKNIIINNLYETINKKNNELLNITKEKNHFYDMYNSVINSTSWKITKPIRETIEFFKKIKLR